MPPRRIDSPRAQGLMAGWLGKARCRDDRLVMLPLFRGAASLILQPGFRGRRRIPVASFIHSNTGISNHIHQGRHQQLFAETQFAKVLPCPASRSDYRIIRLVASGAESVTNQRPRGLFTLRRVADHGPIGAAGAVKITSSRRIASRLSRILQSSTALPWPHASLPHLIVRALCSFTDGGAHYDYTRNVEQLTSRYPPSRHQVLATCSEIRHMGIGREIGLHRSPRLRASSCHRTLFSIVAG